MEIITGRKLLRVLILMAALPTGALAQTPAGACGSQPFCVETNDFMATVTSFRTSTTTSNVKVIDATVRFQNRTNHLLILGYVMSSGVATDDRGNRLIVGGPNGYHGIGLIAGGNLEPRFRLRPGAYGDAQFELLAQGWPKLVGFNHSLDLTVDEINSLEGNQFTLGGEFPLHFQNLSNGSAAGTAALGTLGSAAAGSPCGLVGAQDAAGKASSTVANAASALSSLGSLFGKKKTAQHAGQVADAASGCDPRMTSAAAVVGTAAGASAAVNAQPAPAASAAPTQQPQQGLVSTGDKSPPQSISQGPAPGNASIQAGGGAEPWTPPAEGNPTSARSGPVSIEPSKMPDVIGVHLGMDPKEALAVTRSHYPKNSITPYNNNMSTFPTPVFQGAYVNPANNSEDDFNFQATLPPEKQMVWKVRRITKSMHINRETLLAALRSKYGKESAAIGVDQTKPPSSDSEIIELLWLFDESGHHIPLPYSTVTTALGCSTNTPTGPGAAYLLTEATGGKFDASGWCASSYVGLHVTIGHTEQIVENVFTEMMDLQLALRTAHSTAVWYRAQAQKARQQDLEKSKQAKPVL